jgi:chromosome segregation and condensation protein ScpB
VLIGLRGPPTAPVAKDGVAAVFFCSEGEISFEALRAFLGQRRTQETLHNILRQLPEKEGAKSLMTEARAFARL